MPDSHIDCHGHCAKSALLTMIVERLPEELTLPKIGGQ